MEIKPNIGMIIVVGPSGVGKSTLVDKITAEMPILFDTVTYTTRSMRKGEKEGVPYHFVTEEVFKELIEKNFFVEWAHVHKNMYGTSREEIDQAIGSGRVVIMDVDVQGAKTFREKYPNSFTVFVLPPSIDELRQRIKKRDKMDEGELEIRMENARLEMAQASDFDMQLVNADFNSSYSQFKKVVEEIVKNR
ncbi:MAG: guanylate kinase [Bdellovibrionales bacterium]|nr:guanylate kinase [Bdellovibrionales bacterium]